MKVILTCDTGLPLFRVEWITDAVSLSQLPRLLVLGLLTTEVEFLLEFVAILTPLTQLTCPV